MRKVIVIALIVVVLTISTVWMLLREKPRAVRGPWGEIPIEEAVTTIKAYVVEQEKIPKENIQINKIELRPPMESEENYLRESRQGKEPPELIWVASVTRFTWVGPVPENLKPMGYAGTVWLDAYTGEIVLATFLD